MVYIYSVYTFFFSGDKNQDDLVWSSGEEEVFDVSSVKQSRFGFPVV